MSQDKIIDPIRRLSAHEMSFADFAASVKPSGAVNRLPQIGSGDPVLSYSVYMNGPTAKSLPADAQEHLFKDVMVHALTDKLGLDSTAYRDNMKVAELVATRSAWMTAILDASIDRSGDRFMSGPKVKELPESVVRDYELLSQGDGLSHPYIAAQLNVQRALSKNLKPALEAAQEAVGSKVVERVPREVETGKIVSQNLDFTVQSIGDGEVVAHENRRLGTLPQVGKDVTVTYYRGQGQVFENARDLQMSAPYIDERTNDLAVSFKDKRGEVEEVIMFNSVSSFAQFVEDHKLGREVVEQAFKAREAQPKAIPTAKLPDRVPASEIYFDDKTQGFAFDYLENGRKHTVIFSDPDTVARKADAFNISKELVEQASLLGKAKEYAEKQFPNDSKRQSVMIKRVADEDRLRRNSQIKAEPEQDQKQLSEKSKER